MDDSGYCCLLTPESVGRAATMFVATPIIMARIRSTIITVGINFRGWENFVTAKSTTKITKISTLRKLPAIRYQFRK